MLLQLALDFITIPEAIRTVEMLEDAIDIVEIGTPFVVQDGVAAVRAIRLMPPGTSSWSMFSRSSARSSPSMRRETPPPRGLFGISTR